MLTRPSRLLARHPPLCHGQSLLPASHIPSNGGSFTRHQRRFTRLTRPVFPLPVAARMERAALGLSPELRTPPTKSRRRTSGWGQAIEHGPGTTRSPSHQSILQSVVHSQRATSRRTTSRRRPARQPPRARLLCVCSRPPFGPGAFAGRPQAGVRGPADAALASTRLHKSGAARHAPALDDARARGLGGRARLQSLGETGTRRPAAGTPRSSGARACRERVGPPATAVAADALGSVPTPLTGRFIGCHRMPAGGGGQEAFMMSLSVGRRLVLREPADLPRPQENTR